MEHPRVSIAIPYYDTPKTAYFLSRLLDSIHKQTFTDYEIVLTNEPGMAHNHNAGILKAKGEIIKIMQMDDYFAHDDSLQEIVDNFQGEWMIVGCIHSEEREGQNVLFEEHEPMWTEDIFNGNNRLGGISTLVIKNKTKMLFDESLTWLVDCDLYMRYKEKYGLPDILKTTNVVIDNGSHRLSYNLPAEVRRKEVEVLLKRYDKRGIQQGTKYRI